MRIVSDRKHSKSNNHQIYSKEKIDLITMKQYEEK